MRWILASGSPRRKELLATLLPQFEIIPSKAEEDVVCDLPSELVERLAEKKAIEVAMRYPDAIVIGSDTVVALDGEVLGKPKDEEDAARMLAALSGRSHAVYTGVCFVFTKDGRRKLYTRHDETKVFFRDLDSAWIEGYVAGGSPMDKAGGYGIQDGGLVDRIEGSYTNVVGFPVELVKEMIEKVQGESV